MLTAAITACGSGGEDPSNEPTEGSIVITDANSYTSTANLVLSTLPTTANGEDVQICWDASGLAEDLLCHAAEPVKAVTLLKLPEPDQSVVIDKLLAEELSSEIQASLTYVNDTALAEGCVNLADFELGDAPVDIATQYVDTTTDSYLLLFQSEVAPGQGVMSLAFLDPGGSDATSVTAASGCSQLDYSADLHSLTPLTVPAAGPWPVDWRGLTRNGQGGDVLFSSINRVLIAFYEGRDVQYLEDNIFDIEEDPQAKFWEIETTGERSVDLATAKDSAGNPFPGFQTTTSGTWLLGLMCATCRNPAPVMLTILNVSG